MLMLTENSGLHFKNLYVTTALSISTATWSNTEKMYLRWRERVLDWAELHVRFLAPVSEMDQVTMSMIPSEIGKG